MAINHPLPVNTKVRAVTKTCACSGGKYKEIEGTILKVIQNQTGVWYYLSINTTVRAEMIRQVL